MTESLDLAAIEVMDLLPVLIAFVLGFGARLDWLPVHNVLPFERFEAIANAELTGHLTGRCGHEW